MLPSVVEPQLVCRKKHDDEVEDHGVDVHRRKNGRLNVLSHTSSTINPMRTGVKDRANDDHKMADDQGDNGYYDVATVRPDRYASREVSQSGAEKGINLRAQGQINACNT